MSGAARLTEEYRAGQLALRARVTRDLLRLWPVWQIEDDLPSWHRFLTAAVPVVERDAAESAKLSGTYYAALRALSGAPGGHDAGAMPFDREAAAVSLSVTGRAGTLIGIRTGRTLDAARANGFARMAGAAARLALNGGRDAIVAAVVSDHAAAGWTRVTAGTCDYCEELAGEGVQVGDDFPAHDHCACTPEPQFTPSGATAGYAVFGGGDSEQMIAAANEWATANLNWGAGTVSAEELGAIERYTGEAYSDVNDALREGGLGFARSALPREDTQLISQLDGLLRRSAVGEDVTVWRGMEGTADDWEEWLGADFDPGAVLPPDKGFMSTTLYSDLANNFADEEWRMMIDVSRGHKGYFVGDQEFELLLPRGTKLVIDSVNEEERIVRCHVS